MGINIGELLLTRVFPQYAHLQQAQMTQDMLQQEQARKDQERAKQQALDERAATMAAYPQAQIQEINPNTGGYENIALQDSPSFKDAIYSQLAGVGKLDEALGSQLPKQQSMKDVIDLQKSMFDLGQHQQNFLNKQDEGRIVGEMQTLGNIPEMVNNQPARQMYEDAMKQNLANVSPTNPLLKPEVEKDTATAPLKEFEIANGIDPKLRGTPEYRKALLGWMRNKKEAIHITTGGGSDDTYKQDRRLDMLNKSYDASVSRIEGDYQRVSANPFATPEMKAEALQNRDRRIKEVVDRYEPQFKKQGWSLGEKSSQQIKEGDVAVNPKTGARMIVKGGQWQPL